MAEQSSLTPRQQEVYNAYKNNNCSEKNTARALDISLSSVRKNLFYIARKGFPITPDDFCEHAPAGFKLDKTTLYINKDGQVTGQWPRLSPIDQSYEPFWEFLEKRTPILKCPIECPMDYDQDLMLEWKLMDTHLGMLSWAKETGAEYNIDIAQKLIISAAKLIFQKNASIAKAIIVLGGDNLHSDFRSNRTERSGNFLDIGTKYEQNMDGMYMAMVTSIDIALSRAQIVEIITLSGNHDYHSAIALSRILAAHYRNNSRIHINIAPGQHKFSRWGKSFFMYTHGHTAPPKRLATFLLNYIIKKNITGIDYKLIRKAHLHKRGKEVPPGLIEEDGVLIETFPTVAAPESYSVDAAYSQCRATVAEIFHKKYGLRSRMELGVEELMDNR
jgi:hypothetical protein